MGHHLSCTIESISARAVVVPMQEPHKTAGGTIVESPLVLIDITTSDGVIGRGMVFTYTYLALSAVKQFTEHMTPLLLDQALAPKDLILHLRQRFRLLGDQGLVGMALAGIDMALWDAFSRSCEQSLLTLFGGEHRDIPAYGGIGYEGELGSAASAEALAKQGFEAIKAKIGYPTLKEELAVIRAMRSAVGDDVAIMVDYNQSLSIDEATVRLAALEDEGLSWIEEPIVANDFIGYGELTRQIQTPIQCGENWWGRVDVKQALDAQASKYMMFDVMKIGGVNEWMASVALTAEYKVPVSSHLFPEISARLLSCTPNSAWLEYCDWWHPVLKEPLQIHQGVAVFDDSPGLGIEWDEKNIDNFLI